MFGQEPSQMIAGCLGGEGIMFSANWTAIYSCCTYNSPQNFMS